MSSLVAIALVVAFFALDKDIVYTILILLMLGSPVFFLIASLFG